MFKDRASQRWQPAQTLLSNLKNKGNKFPRPDQLLQKLINEIIDSNIWPLKFKKHIEVRRKIRIALNALHNQKPQGWQSEEHNKINVTWDSYKRA